MQIIRRWGLFIVLAFSFLTILPLFHSGFFPMHDDTQVARVFEMGKELKAGVFPVRWVPDLGYGYGYPLFNFYAPLAYYIGGLFVFVGFNALIATKIMFGIGIVGAGVTMYFFAREFWGEVGGVLSGLFYIFFPYHAVDVYVRGDIAEAYAYMIIPLVFLGLHKMYLCKNKKIWTWLGITAFAYAGIITSHNLTAMMVTPFILIVILLYWVSIYKEKKISIILLFSPILFGLGISAFYWLPVLLEMQNTNVLGQIGGGARFSDHFVCFSQLWDSPWGFGGSIPGCVDGLSFKVGKLHILLSFVSLLSTFVYFMKRMKYDKNILAIIIGFLGFSISILLTLEISKPLWNAISPMAFFQYPWRFLILIGFFSSFLSGSLLGLLQQFLEKKFNLNVIYNYGIGAIIVLLLIYFNLKLFQPQGINNKTSADYTSDYAIKWVVSKASDEYLPANFIKPKDAEHIFREDESVLYAQTNIERWANMISIASISVLFLGIIIFRHNEDK